MNLIYELISIAIIYFAGNLLSGVLPVPGSLLSMALFFILLLTGVLKAERYNRISAVILGNLAFFFIPPAVRIMESIHILSGNMGKLVLVMTISNILVMGVTGTVVQFFLKRGADHD